MKKIAKSNALIISLSFFMFITLALLVVVLCIFLIPGAAQQIMTSSSSNIANIGLGLGSSQAATQAATSTAATMTATSTAATQAAVAQTTAATQAPYPLVLTYADYVKMLATNPHLLSRAEWNAVITDAVSQGYQYVSYEDYLNSWITGTYPPMNTTVPIETTMPTTMPTTDTTMPTTMPTTMSTIFPTDVATSSPISMPLTTSTPGPSQALIEKFTIPGSLTVLKKRT